MAQTTAKRQRQLEVCRKVALFILIALAVIAVVFLIWLGAMVRAYWGLGTTTGGI